MILLLMAYSHLHRRQKASPDEDSPYPLRERAKSLFLYHMTNRKINKMIE
jgi:hypothetical protein